MAEFELKPCQPNEVPQWQAFLNKAFGYGSGESFGVDFAPLFEPEALPGSRLLRVNGQIVACATLYKVVTVAPNTRLELGIIGAVATDEAYRNQGYSKVILDELEKHARAQNLDGLILWSEKNDFYAKLGFAPAGHMQILSLEGMFAPSKPVPGQAAQGWNWKQVEKLYDQHLSRLVRTPANWRAIQKISSCTYVQWLGQDGNTVAYLGFGRGKDMKGIIHEWGGDPVALHALLYSLLRVQPGLQLLAHPRFAQTISRLLPPTFNSVTGPLALFKPLKPEISAKLLENVWFWGLDSL